MLNIILFPFSFLIQQLFYLSSSIANDNFGIAIILLSLFVYLLTIPLNYQVNKLIKKGEEKKSNFQHLIDEINSVYSGQTRFFYLKTLYKIHGISRWSDFYSTLKLLVQIPFFLAAYYFLLNLETLKGISFLGINDLSMEDQLISFGKVPLNLLPVLMFLINIISSYIFAKENKSERLILLSTGFLFLILLYKMPSALVLYWTCNNFLSLISESFKSRKWIRRKLLYLTQFQLKESLFSFNSMVLGLSISLILTAKLISLKDYKSDATSLAYVSFFVLVLFLCFTLIFKTRLKKHENLKFKYAFFLFLGAITPLFMYARNNYEFIKDGFLMEQFFLSLIVPSVMVFVILYFWLKKQNSSSSIMIYTTTLITFFCFPMISNKLFITAEVSIPYVIFFFVVVNLVVLNFDKKLLQVFSYVFLLGFIASSYEFFRHHNSRSLAEEKVLRKILQNPKTKKMYVSISNKLKSVEEVPPVYLLIYDGLVGKKVMDFYGLKYDLDFLNDSGFTVYNDILSNHEVSVATMSSVFEMSSSSSVARGWKQRKNMVGYNLIDNLFEFKGVNRTYMGSNFFFKGVSKKPSSNIISVGQKSINGLLEGVLIGEFKFDIELKKSFKTSDWKEIRRNVIKNNNGFLYSHHPFPAHSQNSGRCLKDEVEQYALRRVKALKSLKQDIVDIKKHNPNAIIIFAGDHGGHLAGDCQAMRTFGYKNVTLPVFAETKGTFLAIKWPDDNYKKYDKFTSLQGIFHSIFAYISRDKEILNFLPKEKICLGDFCTTQDGKVLTGKDKDKYIFDVLKNYELEQF